MENILVPEVVKLITQAKHRFVLAMCIIGSIFPSLDYVGHLHEVFLTIMR